MTIVVRSSGERVCVNEKCLVDMGWTLMRVRNMGGRFYKKSGECRIPSSLFWKNVEADGIISTVVSYNDSNATEWMLYPKTKEDIIVPIPLHQPLLTSVDVCTQTDPDITTFSTIGIQTDPEPPIPPSSPPLPSAFTYRLRPPKSLTDLSLSFLQPI